jgi:mono/diheme cytochrome c family protein
MTPRVQSKVTLALAVTFLAGCRLSQATTDRALQRMNEQPRYDVYEASRFFRNGMVMQVPPAGTIARDAALGPVLATGRAVSGAYVSELPVPVTPTLLELGRSRFRIFCAACHGTGGYGGSLVAANLPERRPPSLRSPAMKALPIGLIYQVIVQGFGRMPSYAALLPVDQRWAVVAYLKQLQSLTNARPDERDDSIRGAELRARDSTRAAAAGDSLR